MKHAIFDLFHFEILSKSEHYWLFAYMLLFVPYSFTSALVDPLLALSIMIFLFAPLSPSFLIFVFYMLWEYVTTFTFGITVVLLMQLIMLGKLIVSKALFIRFKNRKYRKVRTLFSFLVAYMLIIGLTSFALGNGLTGLGFFFKVTITSYVLTYLVTEEEFNKLLKNILQVLVFSSLLATIYGMYHEMEVDRWISGMGESVTQIQGTLGTTRMALFYLTSVVFFLYYTKNPVVRYGGVICFSALTMMTVSLTAMALLLVLFAIYMFSIGKIYKTILYSVVCVAVAVFSFPIWSKIEIVRPIIYRGVYSFEAFMGGDTNKALSNREDLGYFYFNSWKNSSPIIQFFGNADVATNVTSTEMHSHNTYLDILFFFGVLGIVLLLIFQIRRFWLSKGTVFFYPYFTIKALFILSSSSVSIMPATYYMFMIFF